MMPPAFDEALLDRDAELASDRAYGVWAAILPVLLGVVSWGVVMLVGEWLVGWLGRTT
jgi:hypothetical protein